MLKTTIGVLMTMVLGLTGLASAEGGAPVFNFETKTVMLNSGYEMPIVGLGTYALSDETCIGSVNALLANGGRLIDTASFYGTEDSVGQAVRESSVPREEIFVTTKLYPNQFDHAARRTHELTGNQMYYKSITKRIIHA